MLIINNDLFVLEKKNQAINFFEDGKTLRTLFHTKSLNLISLSRAAASFVCNELNLETYISRLEESKYGMDEVFFSSLNSNLPDFPGGFTYKCLLKKKITQNIGR